MKAFLSKEIKLCLAPINFIFLSFVVMAIIPNYPAYVSFFYMCLSVFWIFNYCEINKDMLLNIILPVTKNDMVKARCLLVALYEIIFILLSIPFSILNIKLNNGINMAGIIPNLTFYGLLLFPISIFNFIFFIGYYKKGEKPGAPFLLASIIYFIIYIILEIPFWIKNFINSPLIHNLSQRTDSNSIFVQLVVLITGIIFYLLMWFITYKISCKKFEKVNL